MDLTQSVPLRRRAKGYLGMGVMGMAAVLSVGVLVWLLGLIFLKGSRYVFNVGPAGLPAAVGAAWNLNLLLLFLLWGGGTVLVGGGAGWLLLRWPKTRNLGSRLGRWVPTWLSGIVGGYALAQVADPGLQLSLLAATAFGVAVRMTLPRRSADRTTAPPPALASMRHLARGAWPAFAWMAATFLAMHLANALVSSSFLGNYDVPQYVGAEHAGIKAALAGTLWVGAVSMAFAIPIGIMAAIYLNEFARAGKITSFLRASIANLAGVPSIVFGILGLALFVRQLALGRSIAAAGLTLGLLTLPIVIVVSEEALKAVPRAMREAAFGLGASRWQAVRHHVLPYSLPGMLTGSILALSRTVGETAPLIVIGALTFVTVTPTSPLDPFTAIPIQAFYWAEHPEQEFQSLAWGAVMVLIFLVLVGNLAAILLRDRFQRRYRW